MEYSPSRPRDIKRPCRYFLTLDDNMYKTYGVYKNRLCCVLCSMIRKEQTEIEEFFHTQPKNKKTKVAKWRNSSRDDDSRYTTQ